MRRRAALVAGVATLAGCGGRLLGGGDSSPFGTSDGPGEPARFVTRLDGPASTAVGRTTAFEVTVTNDGGERGTYTGTLRAFDDLRFATRVPVGVTLDPAETATLRVELVPRYAGEWPVVLDHDEEVVVDDGTTASASGGGGTENPASSVEAAQTHRLEVRPAIVNAGTTVALDGGLALSVESVTTRRSYTYTDIYEGDARRERTASDGWTFLFATVRVENRASSRGATPGRSEFVALDRRTAYFVHFAREQWETFDVDGEPYPVTRTLDPGESLTGWVVFEVRDPTTAGRVAVGWNRDRIETPPEGVWEATL